MIENFYLTLSEDEKRVFNKYKSNENSFAYNLNNSLRQRENPNSYQADIDILDEIILKDGCDKILILHRATTENLVAPFIEGLNYCNPDYLSTSSDLESIEAHFTTIDNPIYIRFVCLCGTRLAQMETNEQFSGLENEFLLGRNNNFLIIDDRISTSKSEIENIMGKYYALGVNQIRIMIVITTE